jgi:hypothetical protein
MKLIHTPSLITILISSLFISCGSGDDEAGGVTPPTITFSDDDLVAGGQSGYWFLEMVEGASLSIGGQGGPITEEGEVVFDVWEEEQTLTVLGTGGGGYAPGEVYVSYLEIAGSILVGDDVDDSFVEFELQSDGTFTARSITTVSMGLFPDMDIERNLVGEMKNDKLSIAGDGYIDFFEARTDIPYQGVDSVVGTFSMLLYESK